jgi:cytidylate kinase
VVDATALRYERSITIGGLPGTGTTTACRLLRERTGLHYVYAGQMFRDMARQHNMSLEQFGRYCEEHPEIDRRLDDEEQVELLRGPPILLEGRMSGVLAARNELAAFKVWFTCDPWVRAERIVKREGGDVEDRMAEMRRREESEKKRYLAYYNYDTADLSPYDQVIDTTKIPPEEVVKQLLDAYHEPPKTKKKWYEFWR